MLRKRDLLADFARHKSNSFTTFFQFFTFHQSKNLFLNGRFIWKTIYAMKYFSLSLFTFFLFFHSYAQTGNMELPLYQNNSIPNNIPGVNNEKHDETGGILLISEVREPTLTVFLPEKQNETKAAVIICPGGGYKIVAASHEGYDVAKKLNEYGIAAFVLKYRIPDPKNQTKPSIAPLQDVQQSILTVRQRAKEWHIDPSNIGVMGFSAGGHLASMAGTHFSNSFIKNDENISLRPDFMILIYPVISSDSSVAHLGSIKNLLGENPTKDQLDFFSSEKHVDQNTPISFLVHASDDNGVPVENSLYFYNALHKQNVPAAMHIYQSGGHGFGMNNPTTEDQWMDSAIKWLGENKIITPGR